VTVQIYEKHLIDAFAALLDISPGNQEPMVYFYCLGRASHSGGSGRHSSSGVMLVPAHHVILDTSVPFSIKSFDLANLGSAHVRQQPQELQQRGQKRLCASMCASQQPLGQLQMPSHQQQLRPSAYALPGPRSDESDRTDVDIEEGMLPTPVGELKSDVHVLDSSDRCNGSRMQGVRADDVMRSL
jgi:hypothetical protein